MLIEKYKKEVRKERKARREYEKMKWRNQHMISHGKIKILNMVIKDLSNLEQPPKRLSVITRLKHWFI
jgi:hypothetical protein